MKGTCENCAKRETCKKDIGFMFGGCNADFVPAEQPAPKFKLFMGELGNGVTVCNSAVMEHSDYKQIAHISPAGNVKYYVPVLSIPGDALLRIEHTAGAMYENFKRNLDRETVARPGEVYDRMLDVLTTSELLEHIGKKIKGLEANIDDLRPLYLARA